MMEGRRHQTLRSTHVVGARLLARSRFGDGARWRESKPRGRLVSVQRSRQSPDESANREGGERAGLSEAKGIRRQPPATGERRACERWVVERGGLMASVAPPRNFPVHCKEKKLTSC